MELHGTKSIFMPLAQTTSFTRLGLILQLKALQTGKLVDVWQQLCEHYAG